MLLLPHSLHVRNFVASGLVDMLAARGHRLTLLVPRPLVPAIAAEVAPLPGAPAVIPVEPYTPQGWVPRLRDYMPRRWLRRRFRIASYVERSGFSTYGHKLASRQTASLQRLEVALYRRLLRGGRSLEDTGRALESRLPPKRSATRLVREVRPDVLVNGTFIHDANDVELAKAARRAEVPVLGVPVSWDTLTSKGGFLVRPDALAVWGEDTRRHAIDYHGYTAANVFVTGPPHFDIYGPSAPAEPREHFLARHGIDPRKRALLFAGTTVTYWADEPAQLRALSRLTGSGALADCVIWYRPHPRRSYEHIADFLGLPGVHVDASALASKRAGVGFSTTRADLAHYRGLMDACDGVVAAFSTMIIEAALMGKPSVVVAFGIDDGPDRVVQHADYEHMRDVVNTPGIVLAQSLPALLTGVRRMLGVECAIYTEALRKRAAEIAHAEDGRARERMVEAIEQVAGRRR
jgi:hypothetical protein